MPLSFMAAFFAINIAEFPRDADGMSLEYVSKYMCKTYKMSFGYHTLSVFLVLISAAIIAPSIILAFNLQNIEDYYKKHREARRTGPKSSDPELAVADPSATRARVGEIPLEALEAGGKRKQKLFDEEHGRRFASSSF